MALKVADFFAAIGIRVDKKAFAQADGAVKGFEGVYRDAMGRLREANGRFVAQGSAAWEHFGGNAKKSAKTAVSWGKAWKGAIYTVGVAWAAVHIVKGFATMSDSYNAAASRVRLLTDDLEQQKRINDQLFESAQQTGSSFSDVAALYQQVGKAAVDNGRTLEQGVTIVDTINKALKASGAGGEAGAQALRQLSQALGSGTLRGEEFNSVIEQAPYLLDIIAKDMGKTRGEMRKLAEGGQITSKVILKALDNQKDAIDEAYAKRIPLMSEQFARLRNQVEKTFGEMMQDKETAEAFATAMRGVGIALIGTIKALAATVKFMVRHKTETVAVLMAIAAALIYVKIAAIAAWVAFLGPIPLVIAGLALIAYHWEDLVVLFFTGFMKAGEWVDKFITKLRVGIPKAARAALDAVGRFVRAVGRSISDAIRGALDGVIRFITDKVNWLIDKMNYVIRQINRIPGVDIGTIGAVGGNSSAAAAPAFTPIQRSAGAGANVQIGSIAPTININGAGDPNAVADAAAEKFRNLWGNELRTAMDTVG